MLPQYLIIFKNLMEQARLNQQLEAETERTRKINSKKSKVAPLKSNGR